MTQTVAEYLAETKANGAVSEQVFRAYADSDVSKFSSWGIWGKTVGDLSVFDTEHQPWERLRSDVVLMGGNAGKGKDGQEMKKFGNFHSAGHGPDGKLRSALAGLPFEGAFLSDIVKGAPTKGAPELLRAFRKNEVDFPSKVVGPLRAELDVLEMPERVLVILLGDETVTVWDTVYPHLPPELANRLTVVTGVRHHSGGASPRATLEALLADRLEDRIYVPA
jgi:hypothetical protein